MNRLLTKLYFTGLPVATIYHGRDFKNKIEHERRQSLGFHLFDNSGIKPNDNRMIAKEVTRDVQGYKIEESSRYVKSIMAYPLDLMIFGVKYGLKLWNHFSLEQEYKYNLKLVELESDLDKNRK